MERGSIKCRIHPILTVSVCSGACLHSPVKLCPVRPIWGRASFLSLSALHGRPYDGHTLNQALKGTKAWTGIEPERAYVDKGYQGHDYPKKFRVFRSGQKRGVTPQIKRELKRRAAVEPVIGHMKEDGLLGRNYLKGHDGDKINAVLAGAGHNFRLLLNWFGALLRLILAWLLTARHPAST